jgi:D-glycero-alpha-D-manno-heptose-7-phosphate kinase
MTIRARVPLRLGLAGGGTDLSPYCDDHGGAVLNTTIDRYAYAFIEDSADGKVHFAATDMGLEESFAPDFDQVGQAQLKLHAGVLARMVRVFCDGEVPPVRVTTFVDAPPGSGLGSSSALVVALVDAWRTRLGLPLGRYDVAHLAFEIERLDLGLAGGKQDQYAAAFGGINFIEFLAHDRVIVNPLRVTPSVLLELETSMVTCFTGVSRRSERIIEEQQRRMSSSSGEERGDAPGSNLLSLHQLKHDALEMKEALLRGQIGRMAEVLNRSWEAKKRTAQGITSPHIEHLHATAIGAGAIGGKISGAGGGGFLMFIVPPQRRAAVIRVLNDAGGSACGVHLTPDGAESWTV